MIKWFKVGDVVLQNVTPYQEIPVEFDDNGIPTKFDKIPTPGFPQDAESLKNALVDTLGWIVGQEIVKAVGDSNKKDASNSKAIVLLAKLISTLNPDTSGLTEAEANAYNKMLTLAENGYSDSTLLNNALDTIISKLQWYAEKLAELNAIDITSDTAYDDLIKFAESL